MEDAVFYNRYIHYTLSACYSILIIFHVFLYRKLCKSIRLKLDDAIGAAPPRSCNSQCSMGGMPPEFVNQGGTSPKILGLFLGILAFLSSCVDLLKSMDEVHCR